MLSFEVPFLDPEKVFQWAAHKAQVKRQMLPPLEDITTDGSLYMERKWLVHYDETFRGWSLRLHTIHRGDNDEHLHDHPWSNWSYVMRGTYYEQVLYGWDGWKRPIFQYHKRTPGSFVRRRATERHRLIILPGDGPVHTLFGMGPYEQGWGFYLNDGTKVPWREYVGDRAAYAGR